MYQELALLALLIFFYSMIAGRVGRSPVSGPIIFMAAGVLMGPVLLGWFSADVSDNELRLLADIALALILFIDASHADLTVLRKRIQIPVRMLLIGLPGVIFLGFCTALLLFDQLTVFEAAILGTMLAATDAALGKAIITDENVPARLREGLNFESGLNDGLCVPILLLFIALAIGADVEGGSTALTIRLVAEEIGLGAVAGLGLVLVAGILLPRFRSLGWTNEVWLQITVIALAISCFALAQSIGGSGYIAAFTGGLLFGHLTGDSTHDLVRGADGIGESLALLTWFIFGAIATIQAERWLQPEIVLYAALSLTVIRIVPIMLSLVGTGESLQNRLFLGWFGPRGLASIVFALIVLDNNLPGGDQLAFVVVCTVTMSLVLHGISTRPISRRYRRHR